MDQQPGHVTIPSNSPGSPAAEATGTRLASSVALTETPPNRYEALARDAIAFALRPTRRNKLHWASWALALGTEVALVIILRRGQTYEWERWLTKRFQEVPGRQVVFDISSTVTNTISPTFLLIFLAILGVSLALGHRGAAICVPE